MVPHMGLHRPVRPPVFPVVDPGPGTGARSGPLVGIRRRLARLANWRPRLHPCHRHCEHLHHADVGLLDSEGDESGADWPPDACWWLA